MTASERLGRAMIDVVGDGYPKLILESADIDAFRRRFHPGMKNLRLVVPRRPLLYLRA
ncbi:MAG: hypothetical protein ACRC1G_14195 [Bradyrhizobium sp.]